MKTENADVTVNQQGFNLFQSNKVKRINATHFLVKTESAIGSYCVELQEGKWTCDCARKECPHKYAVRLAAVSSRFQEAGAEDARVACRYCGSPDISLRWFQV